MCAFLNPSVLGTHKRNSLPKTCFGQRTRNSCSRSRFQMQDLGPRLDKITVKKVSEEAKQSAALESWLKENGMYLSKLATWGKPKHGLAIANETTDDGESSGRGLVAIKPLSQGELLFEVPFECIITKERAIREVPGLSDDTGDYIAIAILLLQEKSKGEASFWKPYLDILPKDEDIIPLFRWSADELALLKGSPCVGSAQSLRMKVESEFKSVECSLFSENRASFPEEYFNIQSWEWAFSILFSRAIMLTKEKTIALVPYADLLNHSPFCSTYIDIEEAILTKEKYVSLYTDRPYREMNQVFVTYGPKSNAELLLLYGFLVDRNPYDSVDISVALQENDPLWEMKEAYLRSSGVSSVTTFPLYRDRYPMELIEFLRFCVANEEEMESGDFGDYINPRNESAVADLLITACKDALGGYPQTIEEDEKLVSDRRLFQMLNVKNRWAIRQRLCEKRILRRTMLNVQREITEPLFMFSSTS